MNQSLLQCQRRGVCLSTASFFRPLTLSSKEALQWWPGTGVTGMRNDCSWGGGIISCVDENVLKLVLVLVAQVCEYTKNHWIVYFKWENCVIYYLNKVVYKRKNKTKQKNTIWLYLDCPVYNIKKYHIFDDMAQISGAGKTGQLYVK